jgi:hypothetical protein
MLCPAIHLAGMRCLWMCVTRQACDVVSTAAERLGGLDLVVAAAGVVPA